MNDRLLRIIFDSKRYLTLVGNDREYILVTSDQDIMLDRLVIMRHHFRTRRRAFEPVSCIQVKLRILLPGTNDFVYRCRLLNLMSGKKDWR